MQGALLLALATSASCKNSLCVFCAYLLTLVQSSLQKGTHVDALGELAGELARLENAVADIKAYVEGEEAQLVRIECCLVISSAD